MGNNAPPTAMPRALHSLTGCTIAVPAEMPQVLVLATSFLRFHPQNEFTVLLLDRPGDTESLPPGIKLLYPADLGLAMGEEWRLPMLYSGQQLASILVPALLQSLLNSGATLAVYFEVATEIFDSLHDILGVSQAGDAIMATEAARSALGGNLGPSFVAARRGAEKTLRSWFDRLQTQGSGRETRNHIEPRAAEGNSFDLIPHHVIRTKRFAVGYWNLDPETFAWTGEHYEVDEELLRSFDFRGYDPDKPHLLSKHQGVEPWILLSEGPVIAKICDEYRHKLVQAGYGQRRRPSYRFDYLPSGLRIDHRMHQLYRQAYQKYKLGSDSEPPSPFGPEGEEGFLNWLNEPVGKTPQIVTRYMLAVYDDREDLKKAFPDPTGADAAGFRNWYLLFGQRELDLPAAVVPPEARSKKNKSNSAPAAAVNVAGYFRAKLGIGAAARALVAALEASEIPFNTISFGETANRQTHPFVDRRSEIGPPDINIIRVNPDQIAALAKETGPDLRTGRYTIGVWFWEAEDFPREFHDAFNYVDEVWVASEFMRETFLKVSPKPVFKFKLPVPKPEIDPSLSRAQLGLPDQFLFLFSFDFFSVLERKNPRGLIEAFIRAFQPNEGPVLVIKTINGDKRILEMEKLRSAARGRPDVILKDDYLSAVQNSTLTALADCYVSLHRSEGFGLTIAEAMALGKPAIATAYSGNLEFMTPDNSYLCSFRRCKVGLEREPYPPESWWSCPNVSSAAELLRHVYEHPTDAQERGTRAADDVRSSHSSAAAGQTMAERLAVIRRRRTNLGLAPIPSIGLLQDRIDEWEARVRDHVGTGSDNAPSSS